MSGRSEWRRQMHGFTDRQAGFLVTVMLHAGVCLLRQYDAFARIRTAGRPSTSSPTLVARGYATAHACAHHRARSSTTSITSPCTRHRRARQSPSKADGTAAGGRAARWCSMPCWPTAIASGSRPNGRSSRTSRSTIGSQRRELPSLTFRRGRRGDRPVLPGQAPDRPRP